MIFGSGNEIGVADLRLLPKDLERFAANERVDGVVSL